LYARQGGSHGVAAATPYRDGWHNRHPWLSPTFVGQGEKVPARLTAKIFYLAQAGVPLIIMSGNGVCLSAPAGKPPDVQC